MPIYFGDIPQCPKLYDYNGDVNQYTIDLAVYLENYLDGHTQSLKEIRTEQDTLEYLSELTETGIVYAGTDGAISEDATNFSYNATTHTLTVGGAVEATSSISGSSLSASSLSLTGTGTVSAIIHDSGADAGGGVLNLRTSRGGAASSDNDYCGFLVFQFYDDGDVLATGADIYTQVIDNTNLTEDADLVFREMVDGSLTTVMTFSEGHATFANNLIVTGSATLGSVSTETIGLDADPDLMQLALNALTVNGTIGSGAITSTGAIADGAASSFTTGTTIGNLTLADGSITDSGGAITTNKIIISSSQDALTAIGLDLDLINTYNGPGPVISAIKGLDFVSSWKPDDVAADRTCTSTMGAYGFGQLDTTNITSANNFTSTTVSGVRGQVQAIKGGSHTGNAVITTGVALHAGSGATSGGGVITTNYGLKVENQTAGGTNYAIYTGTGASLFGDKVAFTQTDLNEYIDSLNDGYMDYGATTGHRFNANVDITGTINTTSDDNWDLNDYTAGAPTCTGYVTVTINGTAYKLLARLEP